MLLFSAHSYTQYKKFVQIKELFSNQFRDIYLYRQHWLAYPNNKSFSTYLYKSCTANEKCLISTPVAWYLANISFAIILSSNFKFK